MTIRTWLCLAAILLIAVFFGSPAAAGAERTAVPFVLHNLDFQHFEASGIENSSVVHAVLRDSRERLWMGTENGLLLFDGHGIRAFLIDPNTPGDLPSYFAKAISEAPDGTIWIGTWGGGLVRFREDSRSLEAIDLPEAVDRDGKPVEFDQKIWSMDIDARGRIWLGTFTSGLFRYDPASNRLVNAFRAGKEHHHLSNRIDTLHYDGNGRIWYAPIGVGARVIDADILEMTAEIPVPDHLKDHPSLRTVYDLEPDPSGNMLVAYRNTIQIVDPQGKVLAAHRLPLATSEEPIMEVLADSTHTLLIGTGSAIWHFDTDAGTFFRVPAGNWPGAMPESIIWDIDRAANGDILIGSNSGTWIVPKASRQFWTLAIGGDNPSNLSEVRAIAFDGTSLLINHARSIYELHDFPKVLEKPQVLEGAPLAEEFDDRPLWIEGNHSLGFWIGTDSEMHYISPERNNTPVDSSGRSVHSILSDPERERVLTHAPDGMKVIDFARPSKSYQPPGAAIEPENFRPPAVSLAFGRNSDIWVGTFSGAYRYDAESLRPVPVFADGADTDEWTRPFTNFFNWISGNRMIIGGSNGAFMATIDASGAITSVHKMFKGTVLEDTSFAGSIEVRQGTLQFVTQLGVVEYDAKSGSYKMLSYERGVPAKQTFSAGVHDLDGIVVTSGLKGPLIYDAGALEFDLPDLNMAISDIISFRGNQPVPWPIQDGLDFGYSDRVLRFKFGLLDYLNPDRNSYEIRLNGFSDEWLDIGQLNEFSFTNLEAGNYVLEVRGRGLVANRSSTSSLSFHVSPPWWETWWAYTLYTLVGAGSLLGYFLNLRRKLAREREISARLREADTLKSQFLSELEIKVDEATSELRHAVEALEIKNVELEVAQHRAQDASRLKSEFLANMSHEIRTPMNGVLGFTQLLRKSSLDTDQSEYVETIESSAHSLLGIINDILDLSKIEAGKLIIDNTGFNLHSCTTESIETLAPVAYDKGLELILEISSELPAGLRGDPVRLRQVLTNLVGNAIKFTSEGGVFISLRPARLQGKSALEITVRDSGRGISEEDREKLFSAFERGNASLSSNVTGTGLGLVITKKLAEAMGGEISLESEFGVGTRVSVTLPLRPDQNPENRYESAQPLLGKRIHLIDANGDSRAALHELLQQLGANVMAAPELDAQMLGSADIVALGISRSAAGNPDPLLRNTREQVGPDLPMFCFISRMDRSDFRRLGEEYNALCLPKINHFRATTRRIEDWMRGDTRHIETSPDVAPMKSLSGLTTIIADDNRINRYFLRKMLETHGAVVHEACNGREALELLTSDDIDCHIALIDLHMPELDGLDVAERARAKGIEFPMLVVSANVLQETRQAATAAGFDDYILKPVEEDALLEAVHRHCRP